MRLLIALLLALPCGLAVADGGIFLDLISKTPAEGNFVKDYVEDVKRLDLKPLETPSTEHYRIEIVPSFSKPVLIDLVVSADGSADAKAYEVPWNSEPTLAPKATSKHLTKKQMAVYRSMLEQGEFWTRYYFGWGHGLDTTEWIFEGVRGTDHHFFSTAEEVPKHLESAGNYLFRMTIGGEVPR